MEPTIGQKLEYIQRLLKKTACDTLKAIRGLESIRAEIAELKKKNESAYKH